MPSETAHVITKAEAEYALGQVDLEQLCDKFGFDTVLMWWWAAKLKLTPDERPMMRGTDTDVR